MSSQHRQDVHNTNAFIMALSVYVLYLSVSIKYNYCYILLYFYSIIIVQLCMEFRFVSNETHVKYHSTANACVHTY